VIAVIAGAVAEMIVARNVGAGVFGSHSDGCTSPAAQHRRAGVARAAFVLARCSSKRCGWYRSP